MATRSFIAYKDGETFKSVYCHWDGYPEHHLPILENNYTTFSKVEELLEHGTISVLKENVNDCEFYHRDRKEPLRKPLVTNSVQSLLEHTKGSGCEYLYIFAEGKWIVQEM
jgi:hypothetical protein